MSTLASSCAGQTRSSMSRHNTAETRRTHTPANTPPGAPPTHPLPGTHHKRAVAALPASAATAAAPTTATSATCGRSALLAHGAAAGQRGGGRMQCTWVKGAGGSTQGGQALLALGAAAGERGEQKSDAVHVGGRCWRVVTPCWCTRHSNTRVGAPVVLVHPRGSDWRAAGQRSTKNKPAEVRRSTTHRRGGYSHGAAAGQGGRGGWHGRVLILRHHLVACLHLCVCVCVYVRVCMCTRVCTCVCVCDTFKCIHIQV